MPLAAGSCSPLSYLSMPPCCVVCRDMLPTQPVQVLAYGVTLYHLCLVSPHCNPWCSHSCSLIARDRLFMQCLEGNNRSRLASQRHRPLSLHWVLAFFGCRTSASPTDNVTFPDGTMCCPRPLMVVPAHPNGSLTMSHEQATWIHVSDALCMPFVVCLCTV